jgi:chromosome partitioning protein
VAKTTTALTLGACFVEQQRETLLIDLDPQGNLTGGLGLNPAEIRRSAADLLLGNESVLRVSRETCVPGLDLIPSNADMVTAAQFLPLRKPYEPLLRDGLAQPDAAHYEVVIMDCPPSLGPVAICALTAAQLVLIPTQCEYFALQALNSTLKLVNLVRVKTNPALLHRVLITMFDRRGNLHERLLAHVQQHIGAHLLQTMIGVDAKLRESQLAGKPITLHAQASRSAQQYRQLTEELLSYVQGHVLPTA